MKLLEEDNKILEIPIEMIRISPFQPRKKFTEESLKELSRSIISVGLIQPIIVRAITSLDKILYYELISGERRWQASKLAGKTTIKIIVASFSDDIAAEIALIENVQRENLTPIEVAEGLQKLIDVFKLSQDQVAEKIGKKRSTVANYLRLRALPEELKAAITDNKITMGHAKVLLSLSNLESQRILGEMIIKKGLSVKASEEQKKNLCSSENQEQLLGQEQKNSRKDNSKNCLNLKNFEKSLGACLGKKVVVKINNEGKGGVLSINFYDQKDLEKLGKILTGAFSSS